MATRGRIQLRWTRPILARTSLVVSHESFVNFDSVAWGPKAGYERMRNAAGLSYALMPKIRLDAGYLNQHAFNRHGPDESDHVLNTSLAYSF